MIITTKTKTIPAIANKALADKLNKSHIVVIEDEQAVLEALHMRLQHDFRLECCTTGKEGQAYICQNWQTIDLIILDYMLPDMNGLELLSIIRQDSYPKYLPVILQTANSKDILDKVADKPDFYLAKPWLMQQMIDAINTTLNKRHPGKNKSTKRQPTISDLSNRKSFTSGMTNFCGAQQCF